MKTLLERVHATIARELGIERDLNADDRLWDDLGGDSLDQVELLIEIEREFQINVPDEISNAWSTVGDVVATVTAIVEPAAGGAA